MLGPAAKRAALEMPTLTGLSDLLRSEHGDEILPAVGREDWRGLRSGRVEVEEVQGLNRGGLSAVGPGAEAAPLDQCGVLKRDELRAVEHHAEERADDSQLEQKFATLGERLRQCDA